MGMGWDEMKRFDLIAAVVPHGEQEKCHHGEGAIGAKKAYIQQ